jgi:hypothetical protein
MNSDNEPTKGFESLGNTIHILTSNAVISLSIALLQSWASCIVSQAIINRPSVGFRSCNATAPPPATAVIPTTVM